MSVSNRSRIIGINHSWINIFTCISFRKPILLETELMGSIIPTDLCTLFAAEFEALSRDNYLRRAESIGYSIFAKAFWLHDVPIRAGP